MKSEDPAAFGAQIDGKHFACTVATHYRWGLTVYPAEVDRAVDNLVKSGKMFAPQRRDSLPVLSPRGFPEHGTCPLPPHQYPFSSLRLIF